MIDDEYLKAEKGHEIQLKIDIPPDPDTPPDTDPDESPIETDKTIPKETFFEASHTRLLQ